LSRPAIERPKVAMVIPADLGTELDFFGGGERYAYHVAMALRSLCNLTLVTFGRKRLERNVAGMRHVIVEAGGSDPENPVPRPGFFLSERFDLVHVYQLRAVVTSVLALLSPLTRSPLVVTDVGGGGRSLMFRLQLYRLVRRFILISDFSRRLLPPQTWARSAVVKGGIDLARFQYAPGARKRQVVQVGRIMPHKGFNYLIEAAGDDIPVVIVGRVKDRRYFDLLQEMSRGKQVTFRTEASDDEVLELYRTSAVTVSASVYRDVWGGEWPMSELLGLTMLESMAVGTPVVCTAVGGVPEYVVDGETGFVVDPNDSDQMRDRLHKLLDDPDLAAGMGRAGVAAVQGYSWDRVAETVAAEYRRVLR
jgi:glycosyltransferase involved in cell wall biosynthesis